jgi:hypothetical protein
LVSRTPLLAWQLFVEAHLGIGSAIASLAALIAQIADRHSFIDVSSQFLFFLDVMLLPSLFVVIVASAVGCIASWSTWHFVARSLHAPSDEIARRFD